jgi:methyl-accepting chemotaxis protein
MKVHFNFMTKVSMMAVTLIVLTASTMGVLIFTKARDLLVDYRLQELGADVEVNGVRLVAGIDALHHDAVFLSRTPAVSGIRRAIEAGGIDPVDLTPDALWRTQLITIFSEMLESKSHYVSLRYISAEGLELVRVERSEDSIWAANRRELGYDIDDTFFTKAQLIGAGDVYLSDVTLRREEGELIDPRTIMMYASTPIIANDGSVFGVIAVGMDFGTVFDEMLAFKTDAETFYVTNQAGDFLVNSADPSHTFGFETETQHLIQDHFEELGPLFNPENAIRELPASHDSSTAFHFLKVSFDPLNPARYFGVAVSTPHSEIVGDINSFINQGVLITGFLVAGGTILAIFLSRFLIRPLHQITEATQQISDGKFDIYLSAQSRDEFGQLSSAFNLMSERIRAMIEDERQARQTLEDANQEIEARIVTETKQRNYLEKLFEQISHVINTLNGVSAELQSAVTQQSTSATEQVATVTQVVTIVEELRATVQQTAERAKIVTDASQKSVQVSHTGREAVANSVQGMQDIRQKVEDSAKNILVLSERTQQIGEIIDVVNALAEQSKLLALNASIEAARAGEEGKGFAVVAMEVRDLAEQSRQATARVQDILTEIQQATNAAVMITEEGSKSTEAGTTLVEKAGVAIQELSATIEEAANLATQIAASTTQQTSGVEQLESAMQHIKQASVQSATTSQQTEQSTRNLLDIANQLQKAIASGDLE